ncbi:MAG: methyltransferase domain-containing protein [Acidobacteriaceae bacterium]
MEVSLVRQAKDKVRLLRDVSWSCLKAARPLVEGKAGLEIGGPSAVFQAGAQPLPIYPLVGSLDNCDFSRATTWASHGEDYVFSPGKRPGKNIFRDATDLSSIAAQTYDFILSSHNLEHFANPVKAIQEWKRVIRPGGSMIVVLPNYSKTFDHGRMPTSVDHIFEDFAKDMREDDLTHLPEILEKHDLTRDPGAGSVDAFHRRSLANFENRCLHHHVFDKGNSRELLRRCGMDVLAVDLARPFHILLVARVP